MATGIVNQLKEKLILRRYKASYGGALSAGTAKRWLPSEVGYTIPVGYYPVGVTYFNTGRNNVVLDYLHLQYNSDQSTNYLLSVKNVTDSSASSTNVTFDVLFAPEWMVEIIDSDAPVIPDSDISNEPVFKIKQFKCEYTSLAKNTGAKAFTRAELNFFVPEGYEIFSLIAISSGSYRVSISDCDPFSSNRMLTIRNTYTSAVSNTASLGVVFINRKYMQQDTRKGLIIYFNEPTGYNSSSDFKIVNPSNFAKAVTNGDQIFPDLFFFYNQEITFRAGNVGTNYTPSKVEIISGGEYISFVESTCNKFKISEDWTDLQIILKFTFN